MTRTSITLLALVSATIGCADLKDEPSATEQLLLSAVSGAEDPMTGESTNRMADAGDRPDVSEGGDRAGAPPMFRMCDAEGTFNGYVEAYDADASGLVDGEEVDAVMEEHARGGARDPRDHFLHLLRIVYDTDASGEFEETEMETIFADFTIRCEAIHAEVLATYDADGDGSLSEEEQDAAREGHLAEVEADREAMEACRETCERPEGGPGEGTEGGRPDGLEGGRPEGTEGGRPDGREGAGGAPYGPLEREFDSDVDGSLSEAELDALRTEMRERIRSGEKPHPECEAAE